MKALICAAVCTFSLGLGNTLRADDANPTGTWKWTVTRNNQTRERTLKLKLDGTTLTGALLRRDNQETPIGNATYKDGAFSFTVTRERDGRRSTSTYAGIVSGDTIKGTIESEQDGQRQTREWEAKRAAQ